MPAASALTVAPPDILREVFAQRQVYNRRGEAVPLDSNVSEYETALLHAAVRELRPSVSLEVGFARGVSTLAILDALRENQQGHHHVMDPFQGQYDYCGCAMVERAGLAGRYTFHERFADEVIPGLPVVHFAFIDSSHLFDYTVSEFVLTDRKLAVGGVVGFHDMWMLSQQTFVRYVLANRAYEPWLPAAWPKTAASGGQGLKKVVRAAMGKLPGAQRWLAKEFLKPWQDFQLGNLVLLKKTGEDRRDWRFHERF